MAKDIAFLGGMLLVTLLAACNGGGEGAQPTPTPTPDATAPAPNPTGTPATTSSPAPTPSTPTPAPTPTTVPTGSPFSFEDVQATFEARVMEMTLGAPSAGFSGFSTTAFDARLVRGDDSMELSLLVYEDREAVKEDWVLTVGQSPKPKEGRIVPSHISTWWNENIVVVVRASVGDIASGALDVFLAQPKLIFIRHLESVFPLEGVLWMSNPDGTEERQLTPDGEMATFAGLIADRFYYVTRGDETSRTLWSLNLSSSQRSAIFSFQARSSFGGSADVSPEGRYVTYVNLDGLNLLDLASMDSRTLRSTGNLDACRAGTLSECVGYYSPAWSPDGRLLLVGKGFYEGGSVVVVDPFKNPPHELFPVSLGDSLPSVGVWSPYGDAFCAFGLYAAPSGLYVGEPPDWRPINRLPEYELPPSAGRDQLWVRGCQWIGPTTIAFLTHVEELSQQGVASEGRMDVSVYSTLTDDWSTVATADPEDYWSAYDLIAVPGGSQVIAAYQREPPPGQAFDLARPLLIDVATGDVTPVLQQGDFVVAAVVP